MESFDLFLLCNHTAYVLEVLAAPDKHSREVIERYIKHGNSCPVCAHQFQLLNGYEDNVEEDDMPTVELKTAEGLVMVYVDRHGIKVNSAAYRDFEQTDGVAEIMAVDIYPADLLTQVSEAVAERLGAL